MGDIDPTPIRNDLAETDVIAGILVGNRQAEAAFDVLAADHFHDSRHGAIYSAFQELRAAKLPVELTTLYEQLERSGKIDAAGGMDYLVSLMDGVPRIGDLAYAAKRVRECAMLREIVAKAEKIKNDANEKPADLSEFLDTSIESLSEIARELEDAQDEGVTFFDAGLQLLNAVYEDPGIRIFTGIPELDTNTGGARSGELVVLCGPTGNGKTLLTQQIRREGCAKGFHGLFCSAEMQADQLAAREIAPRAGVPATKVRLPEYLTKREKELLQKATVEECRTCRVLDGEMSLSRIRRVARGMKKRKELSVVYVDYDELIDVPGKDEWEQQAALAKGLKSLAIEMRVPVFLISQLRKPLSGEDAAKPSIQRLYGSGAKTKHASIVIFVDRPYVRDLAGDETAARIALLKNRNGGVGMFGVQFNIHSLRFESLPKPQPEQPDWVNR